MPICNRKPPAVADSYAYGRREEAEIAPAITGTHKQVDKPMLSGPLAVRRASGSSSAGPQPLVLGEHI
jgi:hypothetical protein